MPVLYLRKLTGKERSQAANRQLAHFLAFIAGATNAGGYVAVKQYTSHMSGIVSAMADNLALGEIGWTAAGLSALLAFLAGAACTAMLVNWGRRRSLESEYALPLMVEAIMLVCFGLLGSRFEQHRWFPGVGHGSATVLHNGPAERHYYEDLAGRDSDDTCDGNGDGHRDRVGQRDVLEPAEAGDWRLEPYGLMGGSFGY